MTAISRSAPTRMDDGPWYREPWPWLIMAGPAAVVVAGIVTYAIAARTENALVVDNYYKEGLAINRVLDAQRYAAEHHYRARIGWTPDGKASVSFTGDGALPAVMALSYVHPTHARRDVSVALERVAPGEYVASQSIGAAALASESPRWYLRLHDAGGTWQLAGEWQVQRDASVELTAQSR